MKWNKVLSQFGVVSAMLFLMLFVAPENGMAVWVHSLVVNLADTDWTLVGEDDGDWAGYFASPAGDVNGDGLGDALIGAPIAGNKICPYELNPDGSCPGLPKGEGVAYLILGRVGELAPNPLNLEQADASFLGCEDFSMTGRQLYTAGDVNGDGYDDFLISGWKCGENYQGKAYLFLGRPDIDVWGRYFPVEQADASFLGENERDFTSYYVATAGDVNDDGYDDFLITSTHHEYDEPCSPGTPEDCLTCCRNFINSGEVYNIESNSWIIGGSLNVERINHTAILLDEVVLTAGGQNFTSYLDSAELFDPQTGIWELTGNLITARSGHSMNALQNGKALVAGGQNASGMLDSAELYDPAIHKWVATGNMHTARVGHTATLLSDGKVLVVGGQNDSGSLASSELYDPETGMWTETGNLNSARAYHTATLLPDGSVLVIGGQDIVSYLNSTEIYDPMTGTWTPGANLSTGRANHTATLLSIDNTLLVVGGQDQGGALASVELLNLASSTWEDALGFNDGRTYHTAILMPDGRVMVMGGQNNLGSLQSYAFYDPITNLWTYGTPQVMKVARANHIAVSLPGGNVLVAGGRNCSDFGKAYLILGRAEANWGTDFSLANADASFLGEAVQDRLGRSVAGVGDVNGDGFADFLIGAISSDYAAENAGQNYLFLGRAGEGDPRYDPLRPWWGNDFSVARADASFVGEAAGDESGRRVAWVGDVNKDGLDDMLMQAALNDYSAPDAGITYLVLGRDAADWGMHFPLALADASFVGEEVRDQSGRRVSGAGDVNHDGYNDFLIGAPHNAEGTITLGISPGKSYLIYGKPSVDWGSYYPLAHADVIYTGKPDIGTAGYDNTWLKDFNGDGIDDYLIAAFGGRNNEYTPGEVYIIMGSTNPVPTQYLTDINFALEDIPVRFTGEYWEPNGWNDIKFAEFILEDESGSGTGFYVRYDQSTHEMFLYNDDEDTWLGPCIPGKEVLLSNGVVELNCEFSKIGVDKQHTIRIAWHITWITPPNFDTGYNVFLRAVDFSENDSQLVDFGLWPIPFPPTYLPLLVK